MLERPEFVLVYLVSVLLDCQLWSLCSKQERFKFGEVARLKGNLGLAHLAKVVLESLLQRIMFQLTSTSDTELGSCSSATLWAASQSWLCTYISTASFDFLAFTK